MSTYIRKGSQDRAMVKELQRALGLIVDGVFGSKTQAALMNFQSQANLVADGIAGPKTFQALGLLDTDLKSNIIRTKNGLIIQKHHLDSDEYIWDKEYPILNDYLMLHHTAGHANPFRCIDHWNRDKRGRIATEFVLGGQDLRNTNSDHDGVVVQAFPEGCQGWHIGSSGSYYMNRHTVGIEICGFGYLNKEMKNYVGVKAHEDQIAVLEDPFRGFTHWHKYSDAQLKSLKKLILYIARRDDIDLEVGLIPWVREEGAKAFEFKQKAYDGKVKGLLTHTNVRKDKFDCFPQEELLDMLLSI